MKAGEVWLVDLGMAGKIRPCLLLTGSPADDELALVSIIPHTTALRGNRWGGEHLQTLSLTRLQGRQAGSLSSNLSGCSRS